MKKIIYPKQLEYISSFDKRNDPLIKKMEKFASKNKVPILSNDSARFLEQMITITKPKNVLEIGTAIAYSTIRISRLLRPSSKIYTIEKSKNNIKLATEFIKTGKQNKKIKLLEGEALNIIPRLKIKFDFIFLDADKEDYKSLFELSMRSLKKGGVIFIDNLLWQGFAATNKAPKKYIRSTKHIRDFNKIFMKNSSLDSTILTIGDGIGLGIKIK